MMRLMLILSVYAWLLGSHTQVSAAEQNQADSQAIREIQKLDQSQLDFDFLEDNSSSHDTSLDQSSEAALLEALQLLEQSPDDEYMEEGLLESFEADKYTDDENHQLSSDMDEEIEASLDQDINDEIEGVLEEILNEE